MRTTLDLDDRLLAAARRRAADRNLTLTAFVEEALAGALALKPMHAEPYRLEWKTHSGRLLAGVDIADRDSLFDVMEQRR